MASRQPRCKARSAISFVDCEINQLLISQVMLKRYILLLLVSLIAQAVAAQPAHTMGTKPVGAVPGQSIGHWQAGVIFMHQRYNSLKCKHTNCKKIICIKTYQIGWAVDRRRPFTKGEVINDKYSRKLIIINKDSISNINTYIRNKKNDSWITSSISDIRFVALICNYKTTDTLMIDFKGRCSCYGKKFYTDVYLGELLDLAHPAYNRKRYGK